jgi:hypothetical protein
MMTALHDGAAPAPDAPDTGDEVLPDLTALPLAALVRPDNAVLEQAIRLARARRAGAGIVYAGFNNGGLRAIGSLDGLDDDENPR